MSLTRAEKVVSSALRQRATRQITRPATRTLLAPTLALGAVRTFQNTAKSSAPSPPGLSGLGTVPPSYFQRPSLPANTIIRFVPQQTAWIVERMGKFDRILEPGLAILVPFLDRISYVKSLKEVAIEIPSQSAITADNVTLELDGVLFTRVFDAYKARYAILSPYLAHTPPMLPNSSQYPTLTLKPPHKQNTSPNLPSQIHNTNAPPQLRRRRRRIRHLATSTDNNAQRDRSTNPGPRAQRARRAQHQHHRRDQRSSPSLGRNMSALRDPGYPRAGRRRRSHAPASDRRALQTRRDPGLRGTAAERD